MASVQVRILQSGRNDSYGLPLIPGSVVTVDRDYAVSLISTGFASWVNPADAYDGQTNFRKLSEFYSLYQSGTPLGILPGDGGANGLTFVDSVGNFTLSAAVVTDFWDAFSGGGYCYFPSGISGVAEGFRWVVMTSDTAGRAYANTYTVTPGLAAPFVASPTSLSGVATGRITQSTSEITVATFVMPGGSMGPNGKMSIDMSRTGDTTAGGKVLRVRVNGTEVYANSSTTASVQDIKFFMRNLGNEEYQVRTRNIGYGSAPIASIGGTTYFSANTKTDLTISVTLANATNAVGQQICGINATVEYGA